MGVQSQCTVPMVMVPWCTSGVAMKKIKPPQRCRAGLLDTNSNCLVRRAMHVGCSSFPVALAAASGTGSGHCNTVAVACRYVGDECSGRGGLVVPNVVGRSWW